MEDTTGVSAFEPAERGWSDYRGMTPGIDLFILGALERVLDTTLAAWSLQGSASVTPISTKARRAFEAPRRGDEPTVLQRSSRQRQWR